MRRIGLWALSALALTVAGCGGGAGYQLGGAQGGGRGLPEVAMRDANLTVVPPGRGRDEGLALRAFVPGDAGGWTEVTGARCRVTGGDYFDTTVLTPVRIVLPDLGPDAPPLQAECESGVLRGAAIVSPAFPWPAETRASPPQRAWWGGGWWYGFQKSGPMSYPDLAVGLYPAPGAGRSN